MKTPDKVQCAGCGDTLVVHEQDIYVTMDLHEDDTIDLDTVKFRSGVTTGTRKTRVWTATASYPR